MITKQWHKEILGVKKIIYLLHGGTFTTLHLSKLIGLDIKKVNSIGHNLQNKLVNGSKKKKQHLYENKFEMLT